MNRSNRALSLNGHSQSCDENAAFRSNADLARHYFRELMEDGQEHSIKEIDSYIFAKSAGQDTHGKRFTNRKIDSTLSYVFRHDPGSNYIHIRKGWYRKNVGGDRTVRSTADSARYLVNELMENAQQQSPP